MFTGIIEEVAKIVSIEKKNTFYRYTIFMSEILSHGLNIGDSVAHNGCCLTVQDIKNFYITFDVIQETLQTTNLKFLNIGSEINIERSLKYGHDIGGHLISGHVLGTAEIYNIIESKNNYTLWFKINNKDCLKYIFYKGFISIDGISLTIGTIIQNTFCVYLIPETLSKTTIKKKKKGDIVNIEIDMYTKIIVDTTEKFLSKNVS